MHPESLLGPLFHAKNDSDCLVFCFFDFFLSSQLKEPALLVFVLMEARAWMDRTPTVDMDLRASVRRDTME